MTAETAVERVMACPCGASVCSHHNATWFFHRRKSLKGNVRAAVFRWPYRGFWTWCPVIDGEPNDDGSAQGHYDTLQLAYEHADLWVRGKYGSGRKDSAA